ALLSQGNDTIRYSFTDVNGCVNTDEHIVYVDICSGIAMFGYNNDNLAVYPNPASGMTTISFQAKGNRDYTLALYDLPGRIILEHEGKAVLGKNEHQFSLANIAKGIYFIELRTVDSLNKIKLVIQ